MTDGSDVRSDWQRVLDLAYWSQRDRDESDKVLAYSIEAQRIALRNLASVITALPPD